jgi:polysaccharide biosynthesis transport protein
MSRNFELSERERQHRSGIGLPSPSELRATTPLRESLSELDGKESRWATEALLGDEIVEGFSVPLQKGARDQVASLVRGLFLMPESNVRAVTVAATEAGTEVATITLGAAECLSNLSSKRVCVVDADFDHPQLHEYFRPRSPHGLSDVLQGKSSIGSVLTRVASNLWVLPAGSTAESAMSQRTDNLKEIISALRREADYLLLQSPPLSDTNAAIAFGHITDGMVVVLEANRTRRDFAHNLKAKLDAANVHILGAVFNNRTFPIPRSIYSML